MEGLKWLSKEKSVTLKAGETVTVEFEAYTSIPPGTIVQGSCSCVKARITGKNRNIVHVRFNPSFPKHLPGKVHSTTKLVKVIYEPGKMDVLYIRGTVTK